MDPRINRIYLIAAAIVSPLLSLLLRHDSLLARSICMLLVFVSMILAALYHNERLKHAKDAEQQD